MMLKTHCTSRLTDCFGTFQGITETKHLSPANMSLHDNDRVPRLAEQQSLAAPPHLHHQELGHQSCSTVQDLISFTKLIRCGQ